MVELSSDILVTTSPNLPTHRILRIIGPVYGMTIRSRGVGGRFIAGIQGMFGGEITSYVSELENARAESLQRLIENAIKMGANAVIGTDFETSDILQSSAIVFSVYGTAVVTELIEAAAGDRSHCQNCGAENSSEAHFCTKCGATLK